MAKDLIFIGHFTFSLARTTKSNGGFMISRWKGANSIFVFFSKSAEDVNK